MSQNGSIRIASDHTSWDHSAIQTSELEQATAECDAFPKPHVETPGLIARARVIIGLRKVLLAVDPKSTASWRTLVTFLQGLSATEDLALPEVKAAWQELKEAKEAAIAAVNTSLANGCSRPGSGSGTRAWDHAQVDSEGPSVALSLEGFPKIDAPQSAAVSAGTNGGNAPTLQRRLSSRTSLVMKTEAADGLVSAAKSVAKLREMLLADAWEDVHQFLGSTERLLPSMPELASSEFRRAAQELQDVAAAGGGRPPEAPGRV